MTCRDSHVYSSTQLYNRRTGFMWAENTVTDNTMSNKFRFVWGTRVAIHQQQHPKLASSQEPLLHVITNLKSDM